MEELAAQQGHGIVLWSERFRRTLIGAAGQFARVRAKIPDAPYARIMLGFDTAISFLQWVCAMHLSDRAGLRLKLHDLHVLMTVVQAGSMSRAATLLNTTQPAVSRSIAVLERTIGVRLLERNSHGIEPTAYGRALLDGGVAAFDDLRQAVKSIEYDRF